MDKKYRLRRIIKNSKGEPIDAEYEMAKAFKEILSSATELKRNMGQVS